MCSVLLNFNSPKCSGFTFRSNGSSRCLQSKAITDLIFAILLTYINYMNSILISYLYVVLTQLKLRISPQAWPTPNFQYYEHYFTYQPLWSYTSIIKSCSLPYRDVSKNWTITERILNNKKSLLIPVTIRQYHSKSFTLTSICTSDIAEHGAITKLPGHGSVRCIVS